MVAGQGDPVYLNDISGDGGLTAGNNPQAFVDATALNPAPVQGGGGKRRRKQSKSKKRRVRRSRRSKGRRTKHCKCKVCRCKTCKCNKKRSRMTKRR